MNLRRMALLLGAVATIGACGGASESSDATPANSVSAPSSTQTTVVNGEPGESFAPPVTVGVDPANLLIDSSLDIAAIDGPVVLWFWAPG